MKKFSVIVIVVAGLALVIGLQLRSKTPVLNAAPPVADVMSDLTGADVAIPRESRAVASPLSTANSTNAVRQKTIRERLGEKDPAVFKLAPDQVQAFLARNQRNAESLLAAFNVTNDKEFLREAVRRYPGNPFVLASALASDAAPEKRRELIEQFKQASPENPMADYFSARDYLKGQQPVAALKEFSQASGKEGFQDFTVERIQGLEDIYHAAGYSACDAKALAMCGVQVPAVTQLRELGRDMSHLMREYADAGDGVSAQNLARAGLDLAANLRNAGGNSLLGQMVGMVVEREFLNGLDPTMTYDFLPVPVAERLAQLQGQDESIREAARFFDHMMNTAGEAHLVSYFDRLKLYGEAAALEWARSQLSPGF